MQDEQLQKRTTESVLALQNSAKPDFARRCLAVNDTSNIIHYWRRLSGFISVFPDLTLENVMRHLHSLLHISHYKVVLDLFSDLLKEVNVSDILEVVRDVLKREMELFETSQFNRCALFVLRILPVFDQVKTNGLIKCIRHYVLAEAGTSRPHFIDITVGLFKLNICDQVFTENEIFNTVVRKLDSVDSSNNMLKILPYFNSSFHLRDRLLQQCHVSVENAFNLNALRVIELGYQYFLDNRSMEEVEFDSWEEDTTGMELVLDYCLEMKIRPIWIAEALDSVMDPMSYVGSPIAKRLRIKVRLVYNTRTVHQ